MSFPGSESNSAEVDALNQEDQDWLETDLSHFSAIEPYNWGNVDLTNLGKPVYYESGIGFVVEGRKESTQ
jgi:hypothetical protein